MGNILMKSGKISLSQHTYKILDILFEKQKSPYLCRVFFIGKNVNKKSNIPKLDKLLK